MDNSSILPDRSHPPHYAAVQRFNTSVIFFVTVCSKDRKHIFCSDDSHVLVRRAWDKAGHFHVGRYVLMPDHIHLFASPAVSGASLRQWMKYWKTLVSREWPRVSDQPIWQLDYWDTQLRHGDSYAAKWEYVRSNPVRAGLVENADAWAYQGQVHVLQWHD